MRPIAVSDLILRGNCCRFRTASATMSKRPARLPPTWRWMVTAVMKKSRVFWAGRLGLFSGPLAPREARGRHEPDEAERQRRAEDEREEDEDRLRPRHGGEEADEQARAHRDVEELDRAEREVGSLEHPLHRAPVAQV